MLYLSSFTLPLRDDEVDFIIENGRTLDMVCWSGTYPFKIFPDKQLERLDFAPVTLIYGGNGSGKSTLLNVIAEKLKLSRQTLFNRSPFFEKYIEKCGYTSAGGSSGMPRGSEIITSDSVFDYLLNVRAVNDGVDRKRDDLFAEYDRLHGEREKGWVMSSLDDYDELVFRNDARSMTKSEFTSKRLPKNIDERSNGESAFAYFVNRIDRDALYLLDEPENSLSATLQRELARFIGDSARFYGCQFIISTHSPFLLSMDRAKIYDLDSAPVSVRKWYELDNMRVYHELFAAHNDEF